MLIDRAELLKACEIAKPALAQKDLIEELLFFWFDGKTVTAYNDATLGIQVPFVSELRGGLRGVIILGMLSNSKGKLVELELEDKGTALMKVGRTKVRLAMMDAKRAVHQLPKLDGGGVHLTDAFFTGLKAVMTSISNTAVVPDQLGVTAMLHEGTVQLYTTDAKTISWAQVEDIKGWPLKEGERVIMPAPFVECLLSLRDPKTALHLTKDSCVAVTGSKVTLFARLVDSPRPHDFKGVVDEAMKGAQLVAIPSRLKLMLERASVMLMGNQEQAINVEMVDGVLRLAASTFYGDFKDSTSVDEGPKPVKLRANPELVKRVLPLCTKVSFSGESIALKGENFVHLIANYGDGP